jgi:hypothetical protein
MNTLLKKEHSDCFAVGFLCSFAEDKQQMTLAGMWSDKKNVTKMYFFINILYALCKTTVQLGVNEFLEHPLLK